MGIRGPLLQLDLDGRGTAGPFRRARTAAQPWLALGLVPTWLCTVSVVRRGRVLLARAFERGGFSRNAIQHTLALSAGATALLNALKHA
ncbi:MAG: hypothetical protein JWO52_3521 [Gammaproteobacteria bacterium]|jgi:hypothetical protein|nr:hypothetical protein [Gammaproteobacteria bacterium]